MSKKNKPLSHYERLHATSAFKCKPVEHRETYVYRTTMVKNDATGTMVSKTEKVPFDKPQLKYKATDFALQNLIALGKPLAETKMSISNVAKLQNISQQIETKINSINE